MSTRAVYTFAKTQSHPRVTCYIHYDGYPEYAWRYFLNGLNDERGSFLDRFHRGNELAEIIHNGEPMGEEFRYLINDSIPNAPTVRAIALNLILDRANCFFDGLVEDFVNHFGQRVEPEHSLLPVQDGMPLVLWFKRFMESIAQNVSQLQNPNHGIGNLSYSLSETIRLSKQLEIYPLFQEPMEQCEANIKAYFQSHDARQLPIIKTELMELYVLIQNKLEATQTNKVAIAA